MPLKFTEILPHKASLCVALTFMVVGKGLTGKDMETAVREMVVVYRVKA
jgi:hypothetical protein